MIKRFNILKAWKQTNRDRLRLLTIIAIIWVLIKILEEFLPQALLDWLSIDVALTLMSVVIASMLLHTAYLFFAQFYRRYNPRVLNDKHQPSIDIFISAHNEEAVIGETLKHLLRHNYEKLKIYAINDRSKDGTLAAMRAIEKESNGKLIVIDRPQDAFPGKSAALNDAFALSEGEVVCVFDADARIEPGFLKQIVRHLESPLVGAVQAQKVISNPDFNFLTRMQFFEYAMDTYLQTGRDSIRGSVELRGNGQLIKRKTLVDVGGWNEDTLTDDLDLSTCLHVNGWDIRYSPDTKVYEEAVTNLPGLIKQRRRWAEGSIRRYLNYILQLTKPGNLSPNQIFDTFVFIGQFSIPLWISCDIVYEIIRLLSGRETYISFLMMAGSAVGIMIFINQFNGLRIYKEQGFFEAVSNALITNVYFFLLWVSVVMITYRKILFSRTIGTWTRTEHHGAAATDDDVAWA